MANGNGLNTLEYVQKLVKAGMPRGQAEAQASVLYDLITSNLASKRDIADIQRDMKDIEFKIENIRADLKRDIKELDVKIENIRRDIKKDMLIASGSVVFVILTGMVTLSKLGLMTPATQ